MGTMANGEAPDEKPHNVAVHQVLHCLLRTKLIFRERRHFGGNLSMNNLFIQ